MWLAAPLWSAAPHFEGQRWLSAGGFHVWANALALPALMTRATATTNLRRLAVSGRTNAITAQRLMFDDMDALLLEPRRSQRGIAATKDAAL
jgi:hypothetical protein